MSFDLLLPAYTLLAFFGFLAICAWAWACDGARDGDFSAAAALPFNDPEAEAERRRALLTGR